MWAGVLKSGSPRLKSNTVLPSALSCRALAPAARVAEGCTAAAIFEIASMAKILRNHAAALLYGHRRRRDRSGGIPLATMVSFWHKPRPSWKTSGERAGMGKLRKLGFAALLMLGGC